MHRRTWEAKTNAWIVLEGLKGRSVAEMWPEPPIRPSRDTPRRDQCLRQAAHVLGEP